MVARIRRSLYELEVEWRNGTSKELETLIRAFRGIQALPPDNENSFFRIGGYHGEPFRGKGATNSNWWGGYCNHANVLFPTWHRAYLLRLEDALRSIEGCGDVTLPFWDECFYINSHPQHFPLPASYTTPEGLRGLPTGPLPKPQDPISYIPSILTMPTIQLSGETKPTPNPLYSYRLQEAINEEIPDANKRYSKPIGYETVRYPLSGLVGTTEDAEESEIHNSKYETESERTGILNGNVLAWLTGTVEIEDDGNPDTRKPSDLTSVFGRFLKCLNAPNYTVFSNTSSQTAWNKDPAHSEDIEMSLESPHNAIHLAVGGFYQNGVYNADPILGANGDMGANEMAGFDPIFYFHHCFIDYVFWQWQKRHGHTTKGSLQIDYDIGTGTDQGAGTRVVPGDAGYPVGDDEEPGTKLTMDTPLYPFKTAQGGIYTSLDVTDIRELGYEYGPGSLDQHLERKPERRPWIPLVGDAGPINRSIAFKKLVTAINRADYPGSFVIRTFTTLPSGKEVEVGREPILSRWHVSDCANCRDKLDVESVVGIDHATLGLLQGDNRNRVLEFRVEIHQPHKILRTEYPSKRVGKAPVGGPRGPEHGPPEPIIKDL